MPPVPFPVPASRLSPKSGRWGSMSPRSTAAGAKGCALPAPHWTSAGEADGYVMSAKIPDAAGPLETVLLYVPKNAVGLTVAGPWNSLGMRGNASAPMNLKDVEIGRNQALSDFGGGFPQMMAILP